MPNGIGTVMPVPKVQFFDANGDPAAGYKLFVYDAGTTTKTDTYADALFADTNANPVVLDSAGRATIFLAQKLHKFVLTLPTEADPPVSNIWIIDNVGAVPETSSNVDVAITAGENLSLGEIVYASASDGKWYRADADATATSADAALVGVVTEAAVTDAAGTVRIAGRYASASALTAGTLYYISSTVGTLTATPPATGHQRALAFADSTTSYVFPVVHQPSSAIRTAVKVFAYSSGQGNAGGGGDTQLTSYDVTIPANFLANAGDALIVEGTTLHANTANARTIKLQVASGTLVTAFSTTAAVAAGIVPFRVLIRRRTSTTGSMTGIAWVGAAAAGAPTNYLFYNGVATVDWTANQTFKVFASGTTASDCTMLDYTVSAVRGYQSATV